MAGSEEQNPQLTTQQLVELINNVGRHPIERGTLYDVVQDYKDYDFSKENNGQGFVELPILN